jgi:TolB-like protein
MRRGLFALMLLLAVTPAAAQPTAVEAEGSAVTREDAVSRALVSAVEQVTGVAVRADALSLQTAVQMSDDTGSRTELSATVSAAIRRQTGGIVRSYRILSVERQSDGPFLARLQVEVERFQPTTPTGDTRRRLVVSEFRDENRRETEFGRQLRDRLVQHLTQSRRFAILDRDANQAYDREMALLMTDAPLVERVRVGQVLGADYVVIGRMRGVGATRTEQSISIAGETVVRSSARGTLDFQVLEIATRQVRWAASVAVGNSGNLSAVLEEMATSVGREITQTIYPMRMVRADSSQEIILNQGGVTVTVGQRFRAMLLGEELKDPYTGESLGQVEREIGVVEVQRVDTRVSYARLASGNLPPPGAEVVLRLMASAPPRRPAARAQPQPQPSRSMFD